MGPFFLNGIISTTRPRATDPVLDDEWQLEWIENHGAASSLSANDERFIKSNQYYITIHADADPEYFNFGDDGNGKGHPDHEGVDAMVYTISATATTSDMLDYRMLIDGMPQMAIIHGVDVMKYYSFQSENVYKLKFTVTVAQGAVSMYITKNEETPSVKN